MNPTLGRRAQTDTRALQQVEAGREMQRLPDLTSLGFIY